jgi:integration host factor subunit beta
MAAGNRTITKRDSVERIAEKTGLKKTDVKAVLQEFLDEIIDELGQGNRLEFRDFGVFEVRERKARTAQNPKTPEPVPVPAKRTVKFKPGRRMKEALEAEAPATISSEQIEPKPASLAGTPNGQV